MDENKKLQYKINYFTQAIITLLLENSGQYKEWLEATYIKDIYHVIHFKSGIAKKEPELIKTSNKCQLALNLSTMLNKFNIQHEIRFCVKGYLGFYLYLHTRKPEELNSENKSSLIEDLESEMKNEQ